MSQGSNPSPAPVENSTSTASPWGPLRLKLLLIILAIGGTIELAVWNTAAPNRTYQVFFSLPVISALLLAVVLWGLLSGGFEKSALGLRAMALAVVAGMFFGCLRFEGFEGDMIPRYRPRWTPTAEQRLQAFIEAEQAQSTEKLADAKSKAINNEKPEASDAPKFGNDEHSWPEYRGSKRDGIVRLVGNVDWTSAPVEVWRRPIGAGWSSFSVVDGLAFTQEQRGENEVVACYSVETGLPVWTHEDKARFEEALGGPGPRATPTFADGRLFTLGATGLLTCFGDAQSDAVSWQHNILDDAKAKNIDWAMAGSPLVVDGKVIVNPGGANGRGVIAYDAATGKEVWSAGNDRASYAAPKLATLHGQIMVLIFDGVGLKGHDLATGKELWKFDWTNDPKVNAVEPVVLDDQTLLIGSGYDLGGALLKISHSDDAWSVKTAWTSRRFHLKFNAPVVRDGFAYGLDEGILECLDLTTGEMKWKKGRYGYGQLLLLDDVLLVLSEQGEVAIVKATPERYEEVLRFAALNGKTWNHPVVWRGYLLVRNGEEAACFKLKLKD